MEHSHKLLIILFNINTNYLPSFETASSPGFNTAMTGTCCGSMQKFPEPDGTST